MASTIATKPSSTPAAISGSSEISKLGATFYHGIDNYRAALEVALAIFSGVELDYRFDRVDLCNDDQLSSALRPSYDIVLLLRTFHRLVNSYGEAQAKHTLEMLAARCTDKFVALVGDARLNRRSRPMEASSDQALLVEVMTGVGFEVEHQRDVDVESRTWTWFVFGRH